MSADNWGMCPRCFIKAKAVKEKEKAELDSIYGKVTSERYLRALSAFDKKYPDSLVLIDGTFREDYEIGIDRDGEFYINYRAKCSICNFSFEYKFQQHVYKGEGS